MFKKFTKNLIVACKVTLFILLFAIPIVLCMSFIHDILILLTCMIIWGTIFGAFVFTVMEGCFYK